MSDSDEKKWSRVYLSAPVASELRALATAFRDGGRSALPPEFRDGVDDAFDAGGSIEAGMLALAIKHLAKRTRETRSADESMRSEGSSP